MVRAKNLRDEDLATIVVILDGWSGRLSWDLLIEAVAKRLSSRYTRQALHRHVGIKDAFARRKEALAVSAGGRKTASSPQLQMLLDRNERLRAENERLTSANSRLLEQFVLWSYNAHTRDLDEDFLNRPLPPIDRVSPRQAAGRAR